MIDDFVWRAALAGIGIALAAGPLGCFIVWRRMAYFGDSLAHGALLGVALGLAFGIAPTVGVLVVCAGATLLLVVLESQRHLATDTLLGMLAHSALSFGLIAIGLLETVRVDLVSYLFGDVLSVTVPDLYWIYGGSAVVLAVLAVLWRPLLALTVDAELAWAEGVPTGPVRLGFMLLVALVIAVAMKIVGVLLTVSLMIIPAAAARGLARTPEQMALGAAGVGMVAVLAGLWASLEWDTPSGPSMVAAAFFLFLLGLAVTAITARLPRKDHDSPT